MTMCNNRRNRRISSGLYPRFARTALAFAGLFVALGMDGANCGPTNNGNNNQNTNNNSGGPQLLSDDHTLGDVNAPVKVFEYSDLQCPFCGAFARSATGLEKLITEYVDTGKVLFVYRHFPLTNIHPNAQGAAEASECANDQGLFWEFHDMIFADQSDLSAEKLREYAEDLGMDLAEYDACIEAGKGTRVQRDVNSGTALGVSGTPTFYVNGTQTNAGNLFNVIDQKLGEP